MRSAVALLLAAMGLSACTTGGFWPERWIADGASLTRTGDLSYDYRKGIGAPANPCLADRRDGTYRCADGTVSIIERGDGVLLFDGRTFNLAGI